MWSHGTSHRLQAVEQHPATVSPGEQPVQLPGHMLFWYRYRLQSPGTPYIDIPAHPITMTAPASCFRRTGDAVASYARWGHNSPKYLRQAPHRLWQTPWVAPAKRSTG